MERPSRPTLPALGDVVLGKYRVERQVGEGGMGVVFEALHERLDQRVALKLLRPEASSSPEVVARFAREARAAGKLGSRHTARILDIEEHQGLPVMVMEFLSGQDLSTELERRGPLPIDEAVGYVLATCVAMAEAHALGIVHRDLKPSNLFLCMEGGERVVKVLDFGISKMVEASDVHLTSTQGALGTPLYMSPEQVRSAKKVDARTDIWSLGVILYELLTNKPPFFGDNGTAVIAAIVADEPPPIREVRPEVPEALAAIILQALAKRADARPPDVAAFAAMLRPFGPAASSSRFQIPSSPIVAPPSRPSDPALAIAATQLHQPAGGAGTPASTQGSWSTQSNTRSRPRALLFLSALGVVAVIGVIGTAIATRGGHTPASGTAASSVTPPPPTVTVDPKPEPVVEPAVPATAVPAPVASTPPTHTAKPIGKPPPPTATATVAKPPPPPPNTATANPNRL